MASEAFALADALHADCKAVSEFLDASVRPIADRRAEGTAEHMSYLGALLRVTAWLRSFAKLNHPGDYQALSAGCRALFEIAIESDAPCGRPEKAFS